MLPKSPDLSLCDFHLSGPLKKFLKGQRFHSDEDIKDTINDWFKQEPKSFFTDGSGTSQYYLVSASTTILVTCNHALSWIMMIPEDSKLGCLFLIDLCKSLNT